MLGPPGAAVQRVGAWQLSGCFKSLESRKVRVPSDVISTEVTLRGTPCDSVYAAGIHQTLDRCKSASNFAGELCNLPLARQERSGRREICNGAVLEYVCYFN